MFFHCSAPEKYCELVTGPQNTENTAPGGQRVDFHFERVFFGYFG